MGKYRAQLSLPNHLFGTVKVYDDDDAVVQHRVESGMLVRVDAPAVKKPAASSGRKRGASSGRKRSKSVEAQADAVEEPEVAEEPKVVEDEVVTVDAPSSVMTSWKVSD